jgi:hypothetical protein
MALCFFSRCRALQGLVYSEFLSRFWVLCLELGNPFFLQEGCLPAKVVCIFGGLCAFTRRLSFPIKPTVDRLARAYLVT